MKTFRLAVFARRLLLVLALVFLSTTVQAGVTPPSARYIILLIADGWGPNHIAATNNYTGQTPTYQSWPHHWMSTFSSGDGYDPNQAWNDFDYVKLNPTDSAAAATALYTGVKSSSGRINVSTDASQRLYAISEKARDLDRAAGAVSTVYISHATPGAWGAHNNARGNGYAISDEILWGDPNTTGTIVDSSKYGGGHGNTLPPLDVIIGGGHPGWNTSYVNTAMRDKLAAESGQTGAFTYVERIPGSADGGARLLAAANTVGVTRLVGLFGGTGGNIEYRLADGSGHDHENSSLAEMTTSALTVLERNANGFVLMVEGGAVDWAAHGNNMDRVVGEMIDFDAAVQAVIDWVDDPASPATWDNTLVIVTGDHECGYLTAGPGVFPDQPLGTVSDGTLGLEKTVSSTSRRASWEDGDDDNEIDADETIYWAWNSGTHTNTLIPLYAKGVGSALFVDLATGADPVRGAYLDNTDVHKVMDTALFRSLDATITLNSGAQLSWQHDAPYNSYEIRYADQPYFDADTAPYEIITSLPAPGETIVHPAPGAATNQFYEIQALNDPGLLARSRRVGVFHFAVESGN